MWQRITHPDLLIFLEASFEVCTRRRQLVWTREDYEEQHRRLAHARQHADLVIDTEELTIAEVFSKAVAFLHERLLNPPAHP
jgi:hypothetical protein